MTRGRPSTTGISGAAPVARARGEFVPFGTSPEAVFDFIIRTPATLTFVRVQYVTSLYLPVADVRQQHRDLIAQLRSRCSPAVAELWPYNKHGSYRFFRIGDNGITELDSNGNVPENDSPENKEPATCPAGGGTAGLKEEGAA